MRGLYNKMKKKQFIFPRNRQGKVNMDALANAQNRKILTRHHIADILDLDVATIGIHIKQGLLPEHDDIPFSGTKIWFKETIFDWLREWDLI